MRRRRISNGMSVIYQGRTYSYVYEIPDECPLCGCKKCDFPTPDDNYSTYYYSNKFVEHIRVEHGLDLYSYIDKIKKNLVKRKKEYLGLIVLWEHHIYSGNFRRIFWKKLLRLWDLRK